MNLVDQETAATCSNINLNNDIALSMGEKVSSFLRAAIRSLSFLNRSCILNINIILFL